MNLLKALLEHGLDPNSHDYDGRTGELRRGQQRAMTTLFDLIPVAKSSTISEVTDEPRLADSRAFPSVVSLSSPPPTPVGLHVAASVGHAHIITLLLKNGAYPSVKDNFGRTPLYEAVRPFLASLPRATWRHCSDWDIFYS